MAEFGTITLYTLIILAAWTGALALVGSQRRSLFMIHAARLSLYATATIATLSMVILTYAFAVSDFSITYVQRYSDRSMPLFYKITAVWGGQEGSLLLWTWLLAIMSAMAVHSNRDRLRELLPYIIIVLIVVLSFFCLLLLTMANPFETYLVEIPTGGKGLNPLLQNAYMVTHPPALYIGYVAMAIPFAFAIAALVAGHTDESWILAARSWAVSAWYLLTMGLVLGMLWAYEELGWGGYWGWDPVENAGLIPWFTSTAFIHSVLVQERRQMFKVWNMVLAILTFELTIFGTFLTRSGFIQSVHAFAQSDIGWYFLAFMMFVALVALVLITWRRPILRSRGELESMRSREFFFVINNWVLLSAAFLVLVLTIFPNISQLFGDKITIGAPAFNRWMIPIGMTLLILTGIGPTIGWGITTVHGLVRQFLIPGLVALGVWISLAISGVQGTLPLATFSLCAFVSITIFQELVRGARIRSHNNQVGLLSGLLGLIKRNRRRYGGYTVHIGVILMYLGFAGEAFKEEAEVELKRGQRVTVGSYSLRYDGIEETQDDQKYMSTASLTIFSDKIRKGIVKPARWIYFKHRDQPTSEVDIKRSFKEDLFVTLGGLNTRTQAATFKIIINPLVSWIWIGFLVITIGVMIALFPSHLLTRAATKTASIVSLLVLSLCVSFVSQVGLSKDLRAESKPPESKISSSQQLEQTVFNKLACMCPNCPRIPLATCQCGFASNERKAIRSKIAAGWNEQQILEWYQQRRGPELGRPPFGQEALTIPPDSGFNRLFWLLPYALSLFTIIGLVLVGRRWVRGRNSEEETGREPSPRTRKQRNEYEDLLERELKNLD